MPPAKKRRNRPGGKRSRGRRQRNDRSRNDSKEKKDPAEECFEVEGTIAAVLAGTMFRVKLDGTDHVVLAHISGKMRKRFIRLVIGDRVKLEMSPYDTDKARIVYRLR
jgi:translation initiation factor IF-1